MNLITETRKWLSENNVGWESVLYTFQSKLNDGHFIEGGIEKEMAAREVSKQMDALYEIVDAYHKGLIIRALASAKQLLYDDFYVEIPIGTPLFRGRGNETGFLYKKEEMFHIPFEKRYLVGNQRYSVSGLPCLYLGGSPYICWEELGRPDYQKCNFSGFKTVEEVYVYDFCLPSMITSLNDVKRSALILACSIPANPAHLYKDQYIIPQCIFQAIVDKHYNCGVPFSEDNILGIRYYSTHYLNGEIDMFAIDDNDDSVKSRVVNYIFPSISENDHGLSKYLCRAFEYTPPTSIMHNTIKNAGFGLGCSEDEYISSSFGAIDDDLRKELGVDRIREDVCLFFCRSDNSD